MNSFLVELGCPLVVDAAWRRVVVGVLPDDDVAFLES